MIRSANNSGIGIVRFPGSNGDHDALHAFKTDVGVSARYVDYRETDVEGFDALVLPGGFSYGDYLRCGAIARFAPVMTEIQSFAARGGPVLGICNGFQVLTEAHLLPGALLRNESLKFQCRWIHLRIESTGTAWTQNLAVGDALRLPIANGEGAFFANSETLARLEGNGQVVARYADAAGDVTEEANVNGSVHNIAAVRNERGNVVGLMPHPERAANELVGGADGLRILGSVMALIGAGV